MRLKSKGKSKNVDNDDCTDSGAARRSSVYQESNNSSSRTTSVNPLGSMVSESQAPVTTYHFTGNKFFALYDQCWLIYLTLHFFCRWDRLYPCYTRWGPWYSTVTKDIDGGGSIITAHTIPRQTVIFYTAKLMSNIIIRTVIVAHNLPPHEYTNGKIKSFITCYTRNGRQLLGQDNFEMNSKQNC